MTVTTAHRTVATLASSLASSLGAGLALAVTTAVLAVPATASPAPPPGIAERATGDTWSGFRIRADGTAGGGWVGSRRTDGRIGYLIDPGKKTVSSSYGPPRVEKSGTDRSARAAYLLSHYGSGVDDLRAAAVDVAVTSLVTGGRYALSGAGTRRRIDQTPEPDRVRRLARQLLTEAARYAGRPQLALSVSTAEDGRTVTATAVLRDAGGRPMANQQLRIVLLGMPYRLATTDRTGTAVRTFTAEEPGSTAVKATATRVPEWRLVVREPARGSASRFAVAGRRGAVATARQVDVTLPPLILRASGPTPISIPVPGQLVVTGTSPGDRTATVQLRGPFSTPAEARCSGTDELVSTGSVPVTGDGSYPTPAVLAPAPGLYTWSASLPGTQANDPASACGRPVAMQTQPTVEVTRGAATVPAGSRVRSKVVVRGLPTELGYADEAEVLVYGPFRRRSGVQCETRLLSASSRAEVTGNGTVRSDPVRLDRRGYYGIVVRLPAGAFSQPASSRCGAKGSTFRVS